MNDDNTTNQGTNTSNQGQKNPKVESKPLPPPIPRKQDVTLDVTELREGGKNVPPDKLIQD